MAGLKCCYKIRCELRDGSGGLGNEVDICIDALLSADGTSSCPDESEIRQWWCRSDLTGRVINGSRLNTPYGIATITNIRKTDHHVSDYTKMMAKKLKQ